MSKLMYKGEAFGGGIPKGQIENILGNFAKEYDPTLPYTVGDCAIYDGLLYRCIIAVSTPEAFDSSKWIKTDCGTEFKNVKANSNELQRKINSMQNQIQSFSWKGMYSLEPEASQNVALDSGSRYLIFGRSVGQGFLYYVYITGSGGIAIYPIVASTNISLSTYTGGITIKSLVTSGSTVAEIIKTS